LYWTVEWIGIGAFDTGAGGISRLDSAASEGAKTQLERCISQVPCSALWRWWELSFDESIPCELVRSNIIWITFSCVYVLLFHLHLASKSNPSLFS